MPPDPLAMVDLTPKKLPPHLKTSSYATDLADRGAEGNVKNYHRWVNACQRCTEAIQSN